MMSARPIKQAEADDFLELLCTVFGLEVSRARPVFFNEPMFDLSRKWGLFEGRELLSILTTVPIEFGWGKALGIAGVATAKDRRGEGFAGRLIDKVCEAGVHNGETAAYLFAKEEGVYAKHGFRTIDRVLRGRIASVSATQAAMFLEWAQVREKYDAWAKEAPNRLIRNDQRWRYWKWNYRNTLVRPGGGYLCTEGPQVREALLDLRQDGNWALPIPGEWVGLESMTKKLEVPLLDPKVEFLLMGRNAPADPPEMFMTDQF